MTTFKIGKDTPAFNFKTLKAVGVKWKSGDKGLLINVPDKGITVLNSSDLTETGNIFAQDLHDYISSKPFKEQAKHLITFKNKEKALKWFAKK